MVAPVGDDIHRARKLRHDETIYRADRQDEEENDGDKLLTKEGRLCKGDSTAVSLFFCQSASSVHFWCIFLDKKNLISLISNDL